MELLGSQFTHWGCVPAPLVAQLKSSYKKPSEVAGYSDLQDDERDKVQRAWDADEIPEDDQGPGEAVEGVAKKPVKRPKKADDSDEPPKKKARKAKVRDSL